MSDTTRSESGEQPELMHILAVAPDEKTAGLLDAKLAKSSLGRFELVCVSDMTAAYKLLGAQGADVVVLDTRASEDVSKAISRLHSLFGHIPVIVLSEDADSAMCEQALADGAQDYLSSRHLSSFILARSIRFAIDRQRLLASCEKQRESLDRSRRRYQVFVEHHPDAMVVVNEEGRIHYHNRAAKLLLGKADGDLSNEAFGYPVIPERNSLLDIVRRDGETSRAEMRVKEIQLDADVAYLCSLRDVSTVRREIDHLNHRIKIERLVTSISSMFVNLPAEDVEHGIRESLRQLGEYCRVDRCSVFLFSEDGQTMSDAFEWSDQGVESMLGLYRGISLANFTWLRQRLTIYETFLANNAADLSLEAMAERDLLLRRKVKTMVAAAMSVQGRQLGFICFESVRENRMWLEEEIGLLKLVGDMVAKSLRRKEENGRMKSAALLLEKLLENEEIGVLVEDGNGKVSRVNTTFCELFDLFHPRDDLLGVDGMRVFEQAKSAVADPARFLGVVRELRTARRTVTGEKIFLGDKRILELDSIRLGREDEPLGRLWQFRDATERLEEEKCIAAYVRRDVVTGFSNRQRFLEDMALVVGDAVRRDALLGLLLVDLDGFRQVNTTLGFDAGDQVLRRVAKRLAEIAGGSDMLGRVGGDGFALLLVEPESSQAVEEAARNVVWSLARPIDVGEHTFSIGASVGVSLFPGHDEDAHSLYQSADMALLQAKEQGRGNYQVHNQNTCRL